MPRTIGLPNFALCCIPDSQYFALHIVDTQENEYILSEPVNLFNKFLIQKKNKLFQLIPWLPKKEWRVQDKLKEFLLSSGFHFEGKKNYKYIFTDIYFLNIGCLYMFNYIFGQAIFQETKC